MFYKNKKKIISGILIVMIVALAGLVTNKYFNFDRYNNKIEVSNVKVTSRAVSSGNLTKTEKINGYDVINYTIKYKLESVDKEVIHNRIAIVEATLTDEENKYATWNNVSLDNVSSEIINSGKTLKLTINNVTTNEEGAVKVKLNVTGAPNGFSVNPSVTVYEKDSAINETTVTARSIVETNSISGYVINKTVDKYEKNVELKLCKMESGLCTNSKTVYSNNDGSYSFSDLENGTYNISLVNNSGYTLVNDLNSIIINNEGKNINVEVINKANSDVTISKYIKKVIVTENGKTKTYDYGKIDKAVVAVKNMKNATAKIIYGFDISNKSDKARYIKVVKENIPDGLEYDETDSENSNWVNKKGILYNKTLANEAIKPGETRTLSISLKTKNSVTAQNYINNVSMTSENYYTVRYIVDGETVKEMMVLDSDTAVDYKYTKEDYDFIGWYKSSDYKEKFDFATPIDHDVDLYGKLEEQNKVKYKVTYKLEDGTILETKEVTEGKTIPKIEAPVKKGYDFVGFRLPNETEEFDYSTKIYEDTTLIAIYKKKEYKIVFVDGDNENIQKVLYDEKVQKPADPEKELFTFLYWSLSIDGEEFDFETKVTENIKLYAVYKQAYYSVSFVLNDKVINDKVEVGTLLNEPEVELAEQYEKIEWYDENNNIVSFPLALTKNTTLYAKYITKKFDVKFISDGEDLQNIKVEYGKQIEKPNDPTVEGKKFKYWSLSIDGEEFDFGAQIKENITLYAVFDKITYTVKYMNLNDDGTYTQIGNTYKLDYDSDLPLIDNPEKEGYTFKGWSKEKNGEILNLPIKVRENITLYSVYTINEYTVTFHNEENVDKVKVNYNNVVTEPEKPTSSNPLKEFKWWSLKEDGEKFDFGTKITKNIDLYAVYTGNMYTITFIDGEDVKTKKYEAGSLISEPEVNEKEGYTFKYWSIYENGKDLEGNKSEFNFLLTPVENNLTLYAYYEANQMTVEFYNEDEVSKTLTIDYNSVINQSDIPTVTKNGYTFTGWYEKDSEDNYLDVSFDFTKAIKKNIKLYAKYEKLPNGVIFNDENRLESVNVEYGQTTNPIESKGKEGYTFKYWSLDKVNAFDFSSPITSTITLYAVYEINNYSVKFMNMNSDGTYTQLGDTYTISYNGEMPQIENPTLTGYEFKGWSLEENGDVVVLPTVVTKDVTYYAVYNHIKYDITFMSNNEKYGETQKLYYGDKITIPENPEASEGKVFKHWSLTENGDAYDLTTPVTGNLTLYAVFDAKKVKVTFMNQVSDALYEEYDVKDVLYGNALSDYPSNPTREGYIFKYWSLEENGEEYTPSVLKKDVTLYAVYEKEKVKVSFINNDSKYIDDVVIESGSTVTKPDSPSNTDTKIFKYWSLSIDGEEFDFNTKITSNITLYAVYKENTVTITFGNCNIEPITINYNSQIENMPNADTKEGYTFAYWSTSETGLDEENNELRFNVQSNIIEDITLYAIYTHDSYTVTFGNSSIESQTIYYGDKVTKPNDPTGEYPFLYWSTSENGLDADGNRLEFDFNTIVKSDINLYAIYQVEKYTITFMVDGAIYGDIQYVNINEKITVPEEPTKEGNTFKYWSLEENGEAYDVETEITSSMVLYAVFKPNTYNVSFEFNGQLYEKQTVDYGDLAKEPTTKPSKEYYIFDGWYLNDVKYDFNTKITDNIILNAKFNKIETPVIEISPLSWTKDSVTVTITGPEGYTIKYKKASEEYNEYTGAFEVSENTSITARLEKDGVISEEETKNVENIDKLSPSVEKLIVSSVLQNSFLVNIKSTDTVSGIKSIKIYLNDIEEPIKIYTYEENSENKTNTVSETYKVENLDGNSYTIVEGTTYKVKAVVEDFAGNIVNSDEVEVTTKNENYKAAEITSLQGETLETPTQYSTLQDALDACPDSGKCTVSLLDDLNESVEVYDTKDITMDLNGKTLTGVRDNTIINYGKLNVINNTLDSESNPIGGIVSDDTAIKTIGTLQLGENDDSVTLSPSISGTSIGIDNTGTLKFYDGTIKGKRALKTSKTVITPDSKDIVSNNVDNTQILTIGTVADPEAKIDNIYFSKLSQAVTNAYDNSTVEVLRDIQTDSQIVTNEDQEFTLDLKGYNLNGTTTFTGAANEGIIVNNGTMLLTDTTDESVTDPTIDRTKYDYDIESNFVSDGEYSFDYSDGVLKSNNKGSDVGQETEDDGNQYYKNQSTGYIKLDLTDYSGKYAVSFDASIASAYYQYGFAEITESTDRIRYENLTDNKIFCEASDIISSQSRYSTFFSPLTGNYEQALAGGKVYYLHIGYVIQQDYHSVKGVNGWVSNYYDDYMSISNLKIRQYYKKGSSVIGEEKSTKNYITNLGNMTFKGTQIYGSVTSKQDSTLNYEFGNLNKLVVADNSNINIKDGYITSFSDSNSSSIINIENGEFDSIITSSTMSTYNVTGGIFKEGITISGNSSEKKLTFNISDVEISKPINVSSYSNINISNSTINSIAANSYENTNSFNIIDSTITQNSFLHLDYLKMINTNFKLLELTPNATSDVNIEESEGNRIYLSGYEELEKVTIKNTTLKNSSLGSVIQNNQKIKNFNIDGLTVTDTDTANTSPIFQINSVCNMNITNSNITSSKAYEIAYYSGSYNSILNMSLKDSIINVGTSYGMELNGVANVTLNNTSVTGTGEKGIYTRGGVINLENQSKIVGFKTGIYSEPSSRDYTNLVTVNDSEIIGTDTETADGIYFGGIVNIDNSNIEKFKNGIRTNVTYYAGTDAEININNTNISAYEYGVYSAGVCNIGTKDGKVNKKFTIKGEKAPTYGNTSARSQGYYDSAGSYVYNTGTIINFYDGILKTKDLSSTRIDNIDDNMQVKTEKNGEYYDKYLKTNEDMLKEKNYESSSNNYSTLNTAIEEATNSVSPKMYLGGKMATNSTTKNLSLSNFVKDGDYSFDFNDNKLVSNNSTAESTEETDEETGNKTFTNQSTSYIKLDLTDYKGKYSIKVNSTIDASYGSSLGYIKITNSKDRIVFEDIDSTSDYKIASISSSGGRIYTDNFVKDVEGGKVYYIHIGFIKKGTSTDGSEKYTINSISYGKPDGLAAEDGSFVKDGVYSFDRQDDGSFVNNNKGIPYGSLTDGSNGSAYDSTGYYVIDLTNKTGKYELSFDAYANTYSTAEMGYVVLNDSYDRITKTNLSNPILTMSSQNTEYNYEISKPYYLSVSQNYSTMLDAGKRYYLHIGFNRTSYSDYPVNEDLFKISNIYIRKNNAESKVKIKLLQDVVTDEIVSLSQISNIELDLNGHNLVTTAEPFMTNPGKFSIIDSSSDNSGSITSTSTKAIVNTGELTLENVKYKYGKASSDGLINTSGIISLNNTKFIRSTDLSTSEYTIYSTSDDINVIDSEIQNVRINKTSIDLEHTTNINNTRINYLSTSYSNMVVESSNILNSMGLNSSKTTVDNSVLNNVTNSGTNGTLNINSSTMEINNLLLNNSATATIKDSNIKTSTYNSITNSGNLTIENSNIESSNANTITNTSTMNILSGNIISTNGLGIKNTGTLTMGVNDKNVETDTPCIEGTTYGLDTLNGTFNFYDGKIVGPEDHAINGSAIVTADSYSEYKVNKDGKQTDTLAQLDPVQNDRTKVSYKNLQDAINEAEAGDQLNFATTVNISDQIEVEEGKNIIIDLKGYTLTSESEKLFNNAGTIEIKDSSTTNSSIINISSGIFINNNGTLKITGIVINNSSDVDSFVNNNKITIDNCKINGLAKSYIINASESSTTTITNSTITSKGKAIKNAGELTINKLTMKSITTDTDIYNLGTMNISALTYNIDSLDGIAINNESGTMTIDSNSNIKASKSKNILINNTGTLTVNDSTISSSILTTDGIVINNTGTFTSDNSSIKAPRESGYSGDGKNIVNNGVANILNSSKVEGCENVIYNKNDLTITDSSVKTYNTSTKERPYIVNNEANITSKNTTYTATKYNNFVNSGTFNSENNTFSITLDNNSGIFNSNNDTFTSSFTNTGTLNFKTGTMKSLTSKENSTVTLGEDDDAVSTTTPSITSGITLSDTATLNYYDGKIVGGISSVGINKVPTGYGISLTGSSSNTMTLEKITDAYSVGSDTYSSFDELLDDIDTSKTTVNLLKDLVLANDYVIPSNRNIVFNLNGHNITSYSNKNLFTNNGTFTIQGNDTNDTATSMYKNVLNNNKTCVISTMSLVNKMNTSGYNLITNSSKLTIRDSKLNGGYYSVYMNGNGTLSLVGNEIEGSISGNNDSYNGTVLVSSGEIKSINYVSKVILNDGKINMLTASNLDIRSGSISTVDINESVTMSGGSINRLNLNANNKMTYKNGTITNIYIYGQIDLSSINAKYIYDYTTDPVSISDSTISSIYTPNRSDGVNLTLNNNTIDSINVSYSFGSNNINIKSGTINSINCNYGSQAVVYFGDKDTPVSTDDPIINSGGIKADTLYFYDGTIKGSINAGTIYKPIGYVVKTETVDNVSVSTLESIENPEELIEVNSVGYSDLQSAINACEDSVQTTIKLYGNITLTSNITIPTGKNIILDYNGYSINPDTYTVTNNGTFNEINLKDGNNKLVNQSSTEVAGSAIKITKENTKNIAVYEDDKGNNLKSSYVLYKFSENKYEQIYLNENEDIGTYEPTNLKNQLKVYPIGGKVYLDNLPYGNYKLIGNDNSEIVFAINEDGTLSGKIKENNFIHNENILGSSNAQLIFMIQTGQKIINYGKIIISITAAIIVIFLVKKRKVRI